MLFQRNCFVFRISFFFFFFCFVFVVTDRYDKFFAMKRARQLLLLRALLQKKKSYSDYKAHSSVHYVASLYFVLFCISVFICLYVCLACVFICLTMFAFLIQFVGVAVGWPQTGYATWSCIEFTLWLSLFSNLNFHYILPPIIA